MTIEYAGDALLGHLRAHGLLGAGAASARVLPGGVSSRVVLVENGARRLVAKQSLARLAVEQEWLADPRRVGREVACIKAISGLAHASRVPEIIWEDLDNDAYVMAAAPTEARTWKDAMLAGELRAQTIDTAADVLTEMHRTVLDADQRALFGDVTVFDQLRVDPFYQFTAVRHPRFASAIDAAVASMAAHRTALVHGDFSPKNVLVWDDEFLLLDYEVAHWGDPAFDAAFMLCHLMLHGFGDAPAAPHFREAAERFWRRYASERADATALERRVVSHLGCLLLARVDGKSPVDHVSDGAARDAIRTAALEILRVRPARLEDAFAICATAQAAA